MERQRRRRRHHKRKSWIRRRLPLGFALILVMVLGIWTYKILQPAPAVVPEVRSVEQFSASQAFAKNVIDVAVKSKITRPVYPYSVVDGGVRSVKELQQAYERDALVARHYAGFNWKQAHLVKLQTAELKYVSYRRNNQIFWTKKKLLVAAGEEIITDGVVASRGRCGNQISLAPQKPTAEDEPLEAELNRPLDLDPWIPMSELTTPYPLQADFDIPLPPLPEVKDDFAPVSTHFDSYQDMDFTPRSYVAPVPTPVITSFPFKTEPPSPPPPVPEPSTWLLLSSGLGSLWFWRRKSKD